MGARIEPDRKLIEPIELASRDEIAALQRQRLAATLRHVYANVPA
jgi:phenylacetate-CoA ligase